MKRNVFVGTTAMLATIFMVTGCSSSSPGDAPGSASPQAPSATAPASGASGSTVQRAGTFKGDNGKNVAGTVNISDGKVVLSGFSSDDGPDLHVYLTNGASEADVSAGKLLGPIVHDQASQTFSLNGVDPSKYSNVVIHCDKALAVFGDAPLA